MLRRCVTEYEFVADIYTNRCVVKIYFYLNFEKIGFIYVPYFSILVKLYKYWLYVWNGKGYIVGCLNSTVGILKWCTITEVSDYLSYLLDI